jgi:hypothetical protein
MGRMMERGERDRRVMGVNKIKILCMNMWKCHNETIILYNNLKHFESQKT